MCTTAYMIAFYFTLLARKASRWLCSINFTYGPCMHIHPYICAATCSLCAQVPSLGLPCSLCPPLPRGFLARCARSTQLQAANTAPQLPRPGSFRLCRASTTSEEASRGAKLTKEALMQPVVCTGRPIGAHMGAYVCIYGHVCAYMGHMRAHIGECVLESSAM